MNDMDASETAEIQTLTLAMKGAIRIRAITEREPS
jgi:hypothetical protein